MKLSAAQLESYQRDGYLVVPGLFPAEQMDAALDACDRISYGTGFDAWKASGAKTPAADGIRNSPAAGRSQFPTGDPALDRLICNDDYLDIFEQLLGTTRMSYCNAHLFVRSGPNDNRHEPEPWQGYHIDHDTNSILPPWIGTGAFDYVNSHVMLHDVLDDGAPMQMIPGSHLQLTRNLVQWARDGVASARGMFDDIRKVPEFSKPAGVTGPKGTATV